MSWHYPVWTTVGFFAMNETKHKYRFDFSLAVVCCVSSNWSPENYITITFDFNNGYYLSSEEESGIEIFCFLNTKMNILFLFNFYFWVRCNWLILLKCGYTKTKTELVVKTESVINEGFQNWRSLIDPLALTSNKKTHKKTTSKQNETEEGSYSHISK